MKSIIKDRPAKFVINPPFPRNIMFELTNACNHKCIFCGNNNQKRRIKSCDRELFMSLIDEAYELGAREIGFYLNGEPFLCPDLVEYVNKASDSSYDYIYITTNGVLAKKDIVLKLVENGLSSIKFSVNAATRETYELIHGRDDFDDVCKNIISICNAREESKLDFNIFISYIVVSQNESEIQIMKKKFKNIVDEIYFIRSDNQQGYNQDGSSSNMYNHIPCTQIFNRIHVTSEGFLDACCIDYDGLLTIADLHEMSLNEAWNSDLMKNLRQQHLTNNLGLNQCRSCVFNSSISECKPLNENLFYKSLKRGVIS